MAIREEVNARKERFGRDEAIGLLEGISKLYVAKGRSIKQVDLKKERPDDDTLAGMLLGPTGNLRAPTLRRGKTLIVGFNAETYAELFA